MNEYCDVGLELLTPAFLSGADQTHVELRGATVRGLLRWWWRALVGHRYNASFDDMRKAEGAIFGSTEMGLKSPLGVRLVLVPQNLKQKSRGGRTPLSGLTYTYIRSGQTGRIDAGSRFTLRLHWRASTLSDQQVEEVVRAGCSWVALGGIGCRSRKGWGALEGKVESASTPFLLGKVQAWWKDQRAAVLRTGRPLPSEPPAFPQLEFRQVFLDLQAHHDWAKALGSIGKYYKERLLPGQLRWIAGTANPSRRASSVLLTVVRDGLTLRGVICFLPCRKSIGDSGAKDLTEFSKRLSTLAAGV